MFFLQHVLKRALDAYECISVSSGLSRLGKQADFLAFLAHKERMTRAKHALGR